MALLREHFRFGFIIGGIIYVVLFAIASYFHLFGSFYIWLISFIMGFIAMVVGSLLPDLDAPRSPVHDTLLVLFGSLITMIFHRLAPLPLVLSVVPILTVWADRNYLPSHRTAIHTIEAGFIFALLLAGAIYFFIIKSPAFSLWCGFSLAAGHFVHLFKDGELGSERPQLLRPDQAKNLNT